jgi:hypothetical protein
MELADVYEMRCEECKLYAGQLSKNVPAATKEQRDQFAALVRSRQPESIERLFERIPSPPQNIFASGLGTSFQHAINQVFSTIGWDLRLDLLERFLRKQFEDDRRTHVFVSFNYDLALDVAVQRAANGFWQPRDGYGFEFPFYTTGDPTSDSPRGCAGALSSEQLPAGSARFSILKPHGSLNWLGPRAQAGYPQPDDISRGMVLPLDADLNLRYWPSSKTFNYIDGADEWPRDFEILITPPSPNKRPLIQQVLARESAAIREADEIFVVGYSLPRTDKDQWGLIRKAVDARLTTVPTLTIVNHSAPPEYFDDLCRLFMPLTSRNFNAGFADFAVQG